MNRESSFAELAGKGVLLYSDGYRTRHDQLGTDGFPILRVAEVAEGHLEVDGNEERVQFAYRENIGPKLATEGDVILTTKGTVGRRAMVPSGFQSYVYSPQVCFFRVLDRAVLDPRYLYYWFGSPDFEEKSAGLRSQTDMADYISLRDLAQVRVPLPPLADQHAIAHVLGSLDDKIELNRRMNQTLEEICRALFKFWFVDFGPVRAKMEGRWKKGESLPGMPADMWDLWPSEFEESEIGEIPKGWETLPLDKIAYFHNGLALQRFPPSGDSWLPVLKITQLRAGRTEPGGERANSQIPAECIVDDGDVIFSWSGSLEVRIWCGGKAALNQHLFKVTSTVFPRWFYYSWVRQHLPEFREIALDKATTMGHIQRFHLTDALVAVPPSAVLDRSTQLIEPLLQFAVQASVESRSLASTRDALLPKLLSGEIRVRVGETEEANTS